MVVTLIFFQIVLCQPLNIAVREAPKYSDYIVVAISKRLATERTIES